MTPKTAEKRTTREPAFRCSAPDEGEVDAAEAEPEAEPEAPAEADPDAAPATEVTGRLKPLILPVKGPGTAEAEAP